jgi:hypothetical protein
MTTDEKIQVLQLAVEVVDNATLTAHRDIPETYKLFMSLLEPEAAVKPPAIDTATVKKVKPRAK